MADRVRARSPTGGSSAHERNADASKLAPAELRLVMRMKPLDRKLLRDLWRLRGPGASRSRWSSRAASRASSRCRGTLDSLELRRATATTRDGRFADVFARARARADALAERLARVPGVARCETRVVRDVRWTCRASTEPAHRPGSSSIPRRPAAPAEPAASARRAAARTSGSAGRGRWSSEASPQAHGLAPGDALGAVINGSAATLRDRRHRAVARVRRTSSAPASCMPGRPRASASSGWTATRWRRRSTWTGAFNDVALTLAPGAGEARGDRRRSTACSRPTAGSARTAATTQISHRSCRTELEQQPRASASLIPAIFLGVAAFLLNVVLSRLVGTQREQIAALKAFGYAQRADRPRTT